MTLNQKSKSLIPLPIENKSKSIQLVIKNDDDIKDENKKGWIIYVDDWDLQRFLYFAKSGEKNLEKSRKYRQNLNVNEVKNQKIKYSDGRYPRPIMHPLARTSLKPNTLQPNSTMTLTFQEDVLKMDLNK